MAGSLQFQIGDYVRLVPPASAGALATGLTVYVTVYNIDDGSTLLTNQPLSSRGNGLYSFLWNHGRVTKTWCRAVYSYTAFLNSNTYYDDFTIDVELSNLLSESGRSV